MFSGEGKLAGYVGTVEDITERKWAEGRLEDQIRELALFPQLNPAPVLRFDPEGMVLSANPAAVAILGEAASELTPLASLLPSVADLDLEQCIRRGLVMSHEAPVGNQFFQFVFRGVTELGIGQVYGSDITERKSLEAQLRKVSRAVEQSPFAVVITNVKGTMEYVNPSFTRITGYSLEEAKGNTPRILKSGDTAQEQYRELWGTITAGDEWRGELRNRRKGGELYWAMETISSIRDQEGIITHFVAVQEDVTERKSLEEQLLQSQKMESMGQLASGVVHDFNNMLTAIVGYARLSGAAVPPDHPVSDHLQAIAQAAERATNLTRQLLVFTRRQPIEPKVIDLNGLIIDFDMMLRRLLEAEIELVALLAPEPVLLKADATQMEQLLMNLAVNAKDAMPGGGKFIIETANVALDAGQASQLGGISPGQYVMLTVTDTGVGMAEEVRVIIFEPFFTTKEVGKGTGLGLATCFGSIKQSGGHIEVQSGPGQGTTFRIHLPRSEELAQLPVAVETADLVPRGTETVLLAEDEPLLLGLVSYELRDQGYRVLEAANGEEALRVAEGHHGEEIHALVTDIVMPRMGGIELAERFKAGRRNAKVIFMSGYTDKAVFDYAAPEPGVAFLQKPFVSEDLTLKLRKLLDD
jgi:PAS domain S-box-containing protein